MAKRKLDFGPWRGSVSSREETALRTDELSEDSTNWLISPEDGRLVRRGGSLIQLDTITSGHETAGALEFASTGSGGSDTNRASQFVALHSPSATGGAEIAAWNVQDEGTYAAAGGDTGVLCFIDPNTSPDTFHTVGQEFDRTASGHYRQDGAAGEVRMKCVPYVQRSRDYGRFNSAALRSAVFSGSRRVMELDSGVYSPGANSAPYWWNKRYNSTGTSGTERMRTGPWGLMPPLWAPTTTVPAATITAYNWTQGDTFWEKWAFVYADGSIGPAFQTSDSAASAALGGLITVGTVPGTAKYTHRIISNIPLGPKGPIPCTGRIGFRTEKLNRAATTDAQPAADVFYPFAFINDNTTTTYNDYRGSNADLATIANAFFDQTWPPRAQGAVAIDGRTVLWGKLRLNPYAFIIAPTGLAASRDLNVDDESSTMYPTTFFHVRIASNTLYLKKTVGAVTTTVSIALATYNTIQKIIDRIHDTTFTGIGLGALEWALQPVPGVDLNTPIYDTATSTCYLRDTTDCGDDGVSTSPNDATSNNVRAYGPTYPFVVAFTEAYLNKFPTDSTGLWMSQGASTTGDGVYSQFRIALGHRKQPPGTSVGRIMGVEPCTGPNGVVGIVFYERGRFALRNLKSGGSRDNSDYHLVPLDMVNGCVSHQSCFSGPGFAGCLGQDGVWVTNGTPGEGLVLSRDHLDEFPAPGQLAGWLNYAVKTDAVLAQAGMNTYTWIGVIGDRIRVRFRMEAVNYTQHGMDYWFGRGEGANGLAVLYKDPSARTLYGWSGRTTGQKVGVHGVITDSTGRRVLAWQDTNEGTNDGRVDEVDLGTTADDNGTDPGASGFTAIVLAGDFEEIGMLSADLQWRNEDSGLGLIPYAFLFNATGLSDTNTTLTLATTGSNVIRRAMVAFDQNMRANWAGLRFKILDDGSGAGAVDFYRMGVEVETTPAEARWM